MGDGVNADFQHDVGRVAQHPDVVRTLSDERQLAVPGDGDAVEPAQAAGPNVFPQPHVRFDKEKIVTDAEREAPLLCQVRTGAGFVRLHVERFFDQHVHVGLECLAHDVGVRVGRSQDVDGVEPAAVTISASEPKTPSIPQARAKASHRRLWSATATSCTPAIRCKARAWNSAM